jgi:hypothetical protein
LLARTRTLDRQARLEEQGQDGGHHQYQDSHRHVLGDRHIRMIRLYVQRGKQRQHNASKVAINDLRDPADVLFHVLL